MLLKGRIKFNSNNSVIDCTVRDLSATGAQIFFEHPIPIPREFTLEIPTKALSFPCEIRWTKFQVHGVEFTHIPLMNAPASDTRTAQGKGSDPASPGGWMIQVSTPAEPPQVRLVAVAESDPREALAIVVGRAGGLLGAQFSVQGPLSSKALQLLGVELRTATAIS